MARLIKWGHTDVVGGVGTPLNSSTLSVDTILIVADKSNSGDLVIGNHTVGITLAAGAGINLPGCDISTITISGATGDGVGWGYTQ